MSHLSFHYCGVELIGTAKRAVTAKPEALRMGALAFWATGHQEWLYVVCYDRSFLFLLTHQIARDRVQILPDSFIWLTHPHSDSLLSDPYLIWLIVYWSLSDLTHSLIDAHSAAYWYLLSSLTDDPLSSLTHTRSLVYKQAIRYLVALSLTWLLSRIQYSV